MCGCMCVRERGTLVCRVIDAVGDLPYDVCECMCVCVCGKEGPILCRVIDLVGDLPYHLWVYV